MTTLAITNAGTTLSISASLPATYNQAGFEALSFTTVAEIVDMGEVGKVYDLVTHQPIGDRKKYKFRGGYDNGQISLSFAKALSDAGQTILLAASNSDNDYSFRITTPDSRDMYFTAKTMSFKTKIGAINQIIGSTADLQLNSDIVETA